MDKKEKYMAPGIQCMKISIEQWVMATSGSAMQRLNVYSDGDDDKITNSNQLLVKPRGLWDEMDFDEE